MDKEDLSKSDKWLCMMYPRLKLLHKFLKDEGVIFISIDDAEVTNLTNLCNEIFGSKNFITKFIWQKKKGGGNDSKYVAIEHEYVLMYAKNKEALNGLVEGYTEEYAKRYNQEDADSRYYWDTFKRKSGKQYYPIPCPDGTVLEFDENGNKLSWLRSEVFPALSLSALLQHLFFQLLLQFQKL
ncbi:site-specific DNA-methyltransferase [Aliarcobacter cryaerophilus]|nr:MULTISPECIES: site-specific DNA-methyltransferase [Aliarcobacter]MCT7511723.1 site-specific DNA-methyltransferase [Aliarcobacter cryaerophilus]